MNHSSKKLKQIFDLNINKITADSRNLERDDVFIAIKGNKFDGHTFTTKAVNRGAVAVVYQNGNYVPTINTKFIKVSNTRKALATLVSNFYNNVHKKMRIVGITGTNGKTTTSEITYQLLNKLGRKTGLISTVSAKIPNRKFDTGYHVTTPNAPELHKIISQMYKNGCEFLIIETTSHGIDQYRTYGLEFEVSAITNVTPEHLDYHKTFNNYLKTKAKIFAQSKKVILNKWDPSIKKLVKEMPKSVEYSVVDYKNLKFPKQYTKKFPGKHNLENASIAYALVSTLVGTLDLSMFSSLGSIRGRMENIPNTKGINIIIDFAHDATSLEKVLKEVRKVTKNNLILVFGCAGLRDTLKRPKMGKLSIELADKVVLTAEDPRTEKLKKINNEIERGMKQANGKRGIDYYVIDDRQKAIDYAIKILAKMGDTVLITGKGHEKSMCFGTIERPWSDHNAVKHALNSQQRILDL